MSTHMIDNPNKKYILFCGFIGIILVHINYVKTKVLNHLSLVSFYGTQANSAESEQTPHNQDLHGLHTVCLFQFEKKIKIQPNTPRIRNGLVLPIRVGKSSRLKLIEIIFSMCTKPQIQPDKQQIIRVTLFFFLTSSIS